MNEKTPGVKYFAKTNWRNENKLFGLTGLHYHCVIVGKSGSGKSTVLQNLMRSFLDSRSTDDEKEGFVLLDPHGDLINYIKTHIPENRREDVIYLDVSDPTSTIGYNPLKKVSYEKHSLVAGGILETLENIAGAKGWGPKLSHITRNLVIGLLSQKEQMNFSDVLRLLRDKNFRQECSRNIKNVEVKGFFDHEFKQYNPKFDFVPIYNKFGGFLAHPALRRLFVENEDNLSLSKVMDEGKILLVSLPKGKISTEGAKLVGSLLLNSIALAGFSRVDIPPEKRRPFTVFIDEAHVFSNTSNISGMLEELRKMKVSVCMCFQHLTQMDIRLRDSIFADVENIIAFRTSAKDAQFLLQQMPHPTRPFTVSDFVNLPRYHIILKMVLANGKPTIPFTATTIQYDDYF